MEQYLITLLVKLGVVASIAAFVIRYQPLRRTLLREDRTPEERLRLSGWFSAIFGAGVAIRVLVRSYDAVDLGLEGSMLAGVVGGYVTGMLAGIAISIPAMVNHEYLSLPLFAAIGILGGLVRDLASDKEDIWRFSPLFDLNLIRALTKGHNYRRALVHIVFVGAILVAEFLRQTLGDIFPGRLFSVDDTWRDPGFLGSLAVYVTTFFAVALPLKVWNGTRTEVKLEEQERLLMHARLEALTSQINPHFLFNTLNSVSALIRTNPQEARGVVLKLSRILRRRLRQNDAFASLRDELAFINDYLSIEMTRFGEKLRFVESIDPDTLDMLIPSMLLQPLVENSIKHGLASKVEGGVITIETHKLDRCVQMVVADDGVGIPEEKLATLLSEGIGVSNVAERLKVLFGTDYKMGIDSRTGQGTRISIEVPQPSFAPIS